MGDIEQVIQIANLIDTLGTLAVLILAVFAFYSGKLISFKVHNDIVDVYRTESEKLTSAFSESMDATVEKLNGMDKSNIAYRGKIDRVVDELIETNRASVKAREQSTKEMKIVTKKIVEGLSAIEEAVINGGGRA